MKVTLVSSRFLGSPTGFSGVNGPTLLGGLEINALETCRLLLRLGHDVNVVQADNGLNVSEYEGFKIDYVPTFNSSNIAFSLLSFNVKWRKYVEKDSIVHIQDYVHAFPKVGGINSTNHPGIEWDCPNMHYVSRFIRKYIFKRLLKAGVMVRASDSSVLSYVQSELPKHANQVYPIPNFVDTNIFRPMEIKRAELGLPEEKITILFPRTTTIRRGALVFLKSLFMLSRANIDYIAVFVGGVKKSDINLVQEEVRRLKLQSDVLFVGHMEREKLVHYYNASDIVTFPSYCSEGSSIGCLEAMACGKPVVVTDIGGLKEIIYRDIIDGGFHAKPTPNDLANAFLKLATNEEIRAKIGSYARQRVLKYYNKQLWEKGMIDFFEKVFESARRAR